MGFRIPKLCQILKRFSRTIHHLQTSYYFIRVSRYVKKPTSKYITKFDTTLQWLPTFKTTRKLPQNYAFATTYCFYHQPSLWWTFQKDLFSSSFFYIYQKTMVPNEEIFTEKKKKMIHCCRIKYIPYKGLLLSYSCRK